MADSVKKTYHASLRAFPKKPHIIKGKLEEMHRQIREFDAGASLDYAKQLVVFTGDAQLAEKIGRSYIVADPREERGGADASAQKTDERGAYIGLLREGTA